MHESLPDAIQDTNKNKRVTPKQLIHRWQLHTNNSHEIIYRQDEEHALEIRKDPYLKKETG